MIRRPFLTAVVAAALYAAVLVSTASAQLHNVRVTLVTGQVMTLQVEVAEGATATAAQLPPLPAPAQTIEDLGPVQVPTGRADAQVPVPTATPQLPTCRCRPRPARPIPGTPNVPGTPSTPGRPARRARPTRRSPPATAAAARRPTRRRR